MNLKKCLEILELKSAGSLDDVKKAYRDLANVWHPDRFAGNERLKHKAEKKIREINIAYEVLLKFFMQNEDRIPQIYTDENTQTRSNNNQNTPNPIESKKTATHAARPAPAKPDKKIAVGAASKVPLATRSSSLGKYVMLAFLIVMVVISVMTMKFLSGIDEVAEEIKGPASQSLQQMVKNFNKSEPILKDNTLSPESSKDNSHSIQSGIPKNQPAERYCEIYLRSGSIIITTDWWENGDMVMYKIHQGTLGIESQSVKEIICK